MKKLLFIAIAALCMFACTDQNSPSNNRVAKDGLLPGKFSVSPAQQVQFSQGNLQYQESTNTWRFAERQYDVFGSNNNVAIKSDGWIDMFGWGTGSNPTALENYDFVDWGVNIISNGGKKARSWRTLTIKEWDYLLNGRSNADRLRGFGFVNNVYGMILFPDNWSNDYLVYNYEENKFSISQWGKMEKNGAIFLPGAFNNEGAYWSATPIEGYSDGAYAIGFIGNDVNSESENSTNYKFSVRLVFY